MKRVVSVLLVLAMLLGISSTAFAAEPKITGVLEAIDYNVSYNAGDCIAGKVIEFPLTADMFQWSDNKPGAVGAPVTETNVKDADIRIRISGQDASVIKKISLDYASPSVTGGKKTAVIKVEFVDYFVSTSTKKFSTTIHLTLKSSRQEASKLVLSDTMKNTERSVSRSDTYVNSSAGIVIVPRENITRFEIEAGESALITASLYSGQKYYAVVYEDVSIADDDLLYKYNISTILALKHVGLRSTATISFEDYASYYVYDQSGKYLGRGSDKLPLESRYYIGHNKYDSLALGSSGSSSSSSANTSTGGSSSTASSGSSSSIAGSAPAMTAISTETARTQAATAVASAKKSGLKTATVRFRNADSISSVALKSMVTAANGMAVTMISDTITGTAVTGRITINPAYANNDIKLGVFTDAKSIAGTKALFDKWYSNKVAIVSLGQQGSFGLNVRIAAKFDLTGINTKNLYIYAYDKTKNSFTRILTPNANVDANGYLHFNTSVGGDIVITDKVLTRK